MQASMLARRRNAAMQAISDAADRLAEQNGVDDRVAGYTAPRSNDPAIRDLYRVERIAAVFRAAFGDTDPEPTPDPEKAAEAAQDGLAGTEEDPDTTPNDEPPPEEDIDGPALDEAPPAARRKRGG